MSTKSTISANAIINTHRQAIAGIRKHFASVPTIPLGGAATAPNDAIATLQGTIDAIDAASAGKQAFHNAVAAKQAAIAKGTGLLTDLKMLVKSQLGGSGSALGDFGFTSPSRQTPDEATKAAAVVKRTATRKARGTMGPRAKLAVKGNVTSVVMTPVTVAPTPPAATSSPPAPATPAVATGPTTPNGASSGH